MNNDPLVSIIIANFNGQDYLNICLESVLKSNYINYEIIITDDGSSDRSVEIIQNYIQKSDKVQLIKNPSNKGASSSRNSASKIAKGEILIFLDNDTEVTVDWIQGFLKIFAENRNVGAVQSLLMDYQNRQSVQNAGVKIWAATGWGLPIKYNNKSEQIIAISAALAIKTEVFNKTRGFDEKESVVTEDLDLSWRIYLLGHQILIAPESIVYHWTKPVEMRQNLKHNHRKIYFHLTKNSIVSILKNYQISNALKFLITSLVISIARSILVVVKRSDFSALVGTCEAVLWSIKNAKHIFTQRRLVQQSRKINDNDLFKTVFIDEDPRLIYKTYFIQSNLV